MFSNAQEGTFFENRKSYYFLYKTSAVFVLMLFKIPHTMGNHLDRAICKILGDLITCRQKKISVISERLLVEQFKTRRLWVFD